MAYTSTWQAASNGASSHRWFVWRHPDSRGAEALSDKRGRRRRFKTYEAAKKAADSANAAT